MSKKKKMSNGKFIAWWAPFLGLAAVLIIGIEVAVSFTSTILDTYVGKGQVVKTLAEGTETWDTAYYEQKYSSGTAGSTGSAAGSAQALAAAEDTVEKITDEGMVLLKNNGALPLSTSTTVALMGRGSVDPVYGGSGSGNVDTSRCATPISGLTSAGFTVDSTVNTFFANNYSNYPRQAIVMDNYDGSTFFIGEIPTSAYTFGTTQVSGENAVVFISRCGGEGLDLSTNLLRDSETTASKTLLDSNANAKAEYDNYVEGQHELELSAEEKGMIEYAKANAATVTVVLNASTPIEIAELRDDEGVDAIVWAGSPGSTGFNSLGKILAGTVNPSGRLPDIYAADFTADPTFQNFAINGENEYEGTYTSSIWTGNGGTNLAHFVDYEEGVYVGYKYYETAFEEGVLANEAAYDAAVAYPFGHGLSYTTFSKEITSSNVGNNSVTVTVKVTNTGSKAGKEVVQLYYSAPYVTAGIEKPAAVLGAFAKTATLNAGASEEVTLTIDFEDMASYDYITNKAYVLEAGDYTVSLRDNSHDVLGEVDFTVGSTIVYGENNKRPSDEVAVTNQFDFMSAYFTGGHATNLTRSNFSGTFPTAAVEAETKAENLVVGSTTVNDLLGDNYTVVNNESDVMPTMGATYGLQAIDLRGVDYNDEAWDQLMDQLTEADYNAATTYLYNNAYNTPAIESLGLPACEDHDGPQGFSSLMGTYENVCAYMSEPLLAATFNVDLAKEMGQSIGQEALCMSTPFAGWYGPAMNTHRSPFAGRNFEYYSEDGLLAGKIAANVVSGAGDYGLKAYIKHFALNDQETWRTAGLCTWANEQAVREIYLKPFEIVVKETTTTEKYISDSEGTIATRTMKAATGVMSSFNRIGTVWAGGSYELMTTVLREEWGFEGVAISDFNLYQYMSADQGMRAGTDMQLTWSAWGSNPFTDTSSATARIALRKALKNMIYSVTNSLAMQGVAPGTIISYTMSPWRIWLILVDVALGAFIVGGTTWVVIRCVRHKKEDETTSA